MQPMARSMRFIRRFWALVRASRAPLLISLLAYWGLSSPPQVRELYLLLAADSLRLLPQLVFAAAAVIALSVLIASLTRTLTSETESGVVSGLGIVQRLLPGILGALPLIGVAVGLHCALASVLTPTLKRAADTISALSSEESIASAMHLLKSQSWTPWLDEAPTPEALSHIRSLLTSIVPPPLLELPEWTHQVSVRIYGAIAFSLFVAALLILMFARRPPVATVAARPKIFHPAIITAAVASFAVLTAVFTAQSFGPSLLSFDFTSIPRGVGALSLVALCLSFLAYFCSLLTRWSDRNGVPVIAPMIAFALVASAFNLNDNHAVRTIDMSLDDLQNRRIRQGHEWYPGQDGALRVASAVASWLKARPAEYVKRFADKPYPIYIVAAQGGGMYAANHAGIALARLYDRCPAIRHHIFAISGVSGGSVGAGYLAALLADPATRPTSDACLAAVPIGGKGPIEKKMEELLQTDFLSPVAASLLFPDLLQRFIPYPLKAFDRARGFEAGVESAWDNVVGSSTNPLRLPFADLWRPDGDAPMLFLNTTIVETGRQVVIAPVNFDLNQGADNFYTGLQSLDEALKLRGRVDVPLSTAMSLSARFPIVMPAGLFKSEYRTVRLVDGGYVDNSGLESAVAITNSMRTLCEYKPPNYVNCPDTILFHSVIKSYSFKILSFSEFDAFADEYGDPRRDVVGLNEILSPVSAMFNARIARGELTESRIDDYKAYISEEVDEQLFAVRVSLSPRVYVLPLGWQVSRQTQRVISAQIGDLDQCGDAQKAQELQDVLPKIDWLGVALKSIRDKTEPEFNDINPYFGTVFRDFLKKLRDNQCTMLKVLVKDGIAQNR
jgi:hypothetical protein